MTTVLRLNARPQAARVTLLIALALVFSQQKTVPAQDTRELNLQAQIKRVRYCSVDNNVSSMLVTFALSLSNRGHASIVVPQRPYPLLFVSRSLSDLHKGKYEFAFHPPDTGPELESPSYNESRHSLQSQHVIRSGGYIDLETMETTIPIQGPGKPPTSHLEVVRPGLKYVQVIIQAQGKDAEHFSRATSQPLKLAVNAHPNLERCEPAK